MFRTRKMKSKVSMQVKSESPKSKVYSEMLSKLKEKKQNGI